MMIKLPTDLTLQHFQPLPYKVELAGNQEDFKPIQTQFPNVAQIKFYTPAASSNFYPEQFVKTYLLIKLNSLCKKQCAVNRPFLAQLAQLYNEGKFKDVFVAATEAEIFSQIVLKIQGKITLRDQELTDLVEGNGLLAASAVWFLGKTKEYLEKEEVAFCLSFVSLGGREMAFIPIVHKEKNHAGQIYFAEKIRSMFHVKKKAAKEEIKVQDPYSMRCSPQVHGIAYDCFQELKSAMKSLLNRPHHKYVVLNGKKLPNLLLESDTFALKMDYLICCLQEIGAMSFLRTERILNEYLGKNKLKDRPEYRSLLSMLTSALKCTSQNKILSEMTNFDTCNIDSYDKDIFYNSGLFYGKLKALFENLYYVMTIQIMSSLEAKKDACNGDLKEIQFSDQRMNQNFVFLGEVITPWDKSESLRKIKQQWKP